MPSHKLVFAIMTATLAAPALALNIGRDLDKKSSADDLCVYGAPVNDGGYTINYQDMKSASPSNQTGFVLDEAWVAQHKIGDSSHFFAGISRFPWAENKCQYTCNAMENCVSFVGYQTQDSTAGNGEIYGHYFDAL